MKTSTSIVPIPYLTFFILLSFLFISCGVTKSTNSTNGDSGSDGDNGNGGTPLTSSLEDVITNGTIPNNISLATDQMVFNTLGRLGGNTGASINAIYVTESGSGDYSGSSWANANRGTNLRTVINGISDATADKVYVVLVGAGTYKTTTGTDRDLSFSMKNHTAIIGGFDDAGVGVGSWTRSVGSVTVFDGELGTTADRSDNTKTIFFQGSEIDNTAVLYGAEIRNGGNSAGDGAADSGGGMYNDGASPTIVEVIFTNNYALIDGGGMYNENASPLIIDSSFVFNESSNQGGGMFNIRSSAIVVNTTFASNITVGSGGAMFNNISSLTLVNVTMVGNNSGLLGGGGVYDNSIVAVRGSIWVNGVVWSNTIGTRGTGGNPNQIHLVNDLNNINLTLAGTVLQGNTNDIGIQDATKPYTINNNGVISNDANVGGLTTSGSRSYMPIPIGSSAINIGYHVKINGTFVGDGTAAGATLYYSENGNDWFTTITSSGLTGSATPPNSAISLTKYDVTGQERSGQPDAGAYEAR